MLSLLVEFDKINTKHWGDLVVYMGTEDLCLPVNHCSLQHLQTGVPLILLTHFKALFMIVNVFCLFFVIPRRSRRDIVLAASVRLSVRPFRPSVRNHISVPICQI